jgi:hypothetical protein
MLATIYSRNMYQYWIKPNIQHLYRCLFREVKINTCLKKHNTTVSPHIIQSQITARTFLITQNATHFSVVIFSSSEYLGILSYWSSNRQTKVTRTLWNKAVHFQARTIIGCANVRTRLSQGIPPDRRLQSKKLIALRRTILLESPSLCGATLSISITSP